jgi:hypothetical protein
MPPNNVPGFHRPVSINEYALLEGLKEADVLAVIGQLKIPAAYFRGQWYVEAPPNCEARLAQLRGDRQTPGNDKANIPALEDEEFWAPIEREVACYVSSTGSEQKAIPKTAERVQRPQPVDYGLTHDDLRLYDNLFTWWWCQLPNGEKIQCLGTRSDDKYKNGSRWFRVLIPRDWRDERDRERRAYSSGALAFFALLFGSLAVMNPHGSEDIVFGFAAIGFGLACLLYAIIPGTVINQLRKRASPALEKYWQALHAYDDNKAAAEKAAREAAHDAEMRKRSYWELLDGYAFEQATAEVLRKHQFAAMVTRGSGDGGIDINVSRNGLNGVVQCKAHVNCVGPSVVRDLYGVIHHCGAVFGIIVSRGGFTQGAINFARDKPILFLNTDDLIAMHEGKDVLAAAFAASSPAQ